MLKAHSPSSAAAGSRALSPGRLATYMIIICCAVGIIHLRAGRGMRFFLVPSSSMAPTLLPRDYLVTMKEKEYHRGDIVVLDDPEQEGGYLVKRIVGIGGDTIAVQGGALILDGKYASEPYLSEPMAGDIDDPIPVADGEVFVMGDNRNMSEDSRRWKHSVPSDTIVGKVRYIYHPFHRMGPVSSYPLTNSEGD